MSQSYFGRSWKLTVTPQATGEAWTISNSTWDNEALRLTFEIEQFALLAYWYADISVYNCNFAMQQVIQKGDLVEFSAGYEMPGKGVIFLGKVFQVLWERPTEVDYRMTLHCLVGLWQDEIGKVDVTVPANLSQFDAVKFVASQTTPPTVVDDKNLDPVLKDKQLPRAEAFSGRATKYFLDVALDHHLDCWIGFDGLHIWNLVPKKDTPDIVYAPPYTTRDGTAVEPEGGELQTKYILIGTPEQYERGVRWTTLLDPNVQLGALAKLDMTLIRKLAARIGEILPPLDKDGLYIIAGMRHCGDTRGSDWYTEVTGVTREFSKIFAMQK